MPNYWLGIMAVALAVTLALWIALVFRADRQQSGQPQESLPKREVIGGTFAARKGGRQVMPDPEESIVHNDRIIPELTVSIPEQARREAARQLARAQVPGPRTEPAPERANAPERAQAQGDRH
jgi:hypothetical protein